MKEKIMLSVFLILSLAPAWGQTERQLTPQEIKRSSFITQPATLRKGYIRGSFSGYFSFIDKIFDKSGKRVFLDPSNIFGTSSGFFAEASYGIINRLEAGLSFSYYSQRQNHAAEFQFGSNFNQTNHTLRRGSGLSDIELYSVFQIIKENEKQRSLLLTVNFVIPSGSKNPKSISDEELRLPTSNGDYQTKIAVTYRKVAYPFSIAPSVSYTQSLGGQKRFTTDGPEENFQDGSRIILSSTFGAHMNEWIAVRTVVQYYRKVTEDKIEGKVIEEETMPQSIEIVPAIFFQINRLRIVQGIGIPIWGKLSGADPSYIFRTEYVF